jgi:hypothetical protein
VFLKLWSAVGFGRRSIIKIVSVTERLKYTPINVCAKTALLIDLQQKAGELVISIISCPLIIIFRTNSLAQEPERSSPHSEQLTTGPYPEPVESNKHPRSS